MRARQTYEVRVIPRPVEVEFFFHGGPANGMEQFVPLEPNGGPPHQVGVVTPVNTPFGVGLLRSIYQLQPDGTYHWLGDVVG